ncbi:SGNH/GDSL hydrolase family protein [Terriglobus roseus]|uniref:Lysophospholipase L1 n=1 Tax=Terriglobus roseus TaxID=392734 RepID=A0A1G7GQH9_9BACT|nr:SGNH/GDSL hydrolase family protein [Terriglobus roseus]SDE90239.1 Lysophospholipase L1 [Terriglobus roseus]
MNTRHVVFALLSFCATAAFAQQSQSTATTPVVAAPSPADVERMRTQLADWPNLARYRAEDEALPPPRAGEQRVVFLGDSITDRWGRKVGTFFPGKGYINRGISGQTTPQMLLRFQQDVVRLHPSVLVLLAGTNDIARNTGPSSPMMIEDNLRSMAAIAKDNGIRLVIGSILPAARYRWRPGINGVADIREVNRWLKTFCAENNFVFVDYYTAMADDAGGMKPGLSSDEVHPTEAGYEIMTPLAEQGIAQALNHR